MSDSTSSSTKFKVADKEAECFDDDMTTAPILSQLESYKHNHCTEVLMESQFSSRVEPTFVHGLQFVSTIIGCYNEHHNLIIRPDDIWTAILTQFSFYINKNAEEFRSKFVNYDGTKKLIVEIDGSLRSAPYDLFVTKMTEKIDENLVDETVKEWILPNFTTTTSDDMMACGIVIMAATKKFFHFECNLKCGISYVTLEGTVADYTNILNRLEKLKEFKLDKWYDMLKPILEEFVAAKENKANIEFWNRICNRLGGDSGPSYINGWLTAFAIFDEDGNWTDHGKDPHSRILLRNQVDESWPLIDIDKIPSGIVNVDIRIREGTVDHESIMFAVHVGFKVMEDKRTLKPQVGWYIALKLSAEEVKDFHENAQSEFNGFFVSSK